MEQLALSSEKNRSDLDNWTTLLCLLSLHEAERRPAGTGQVSLGYALTAKEYIDNFYFRHITVEEIAEKINISTSYLYRVFSKRFGLSPKDYLSRVRFEQAQKLLMEGDLSVTEVGIAVGYPDVLAFSKFFRLKSGVSPQTFRRANR